LRRSRVIAIASGAMEAGLTAVFIGAQDQSTRRARRRITREGMMSVKRHRLAPSATLS
jgi:hypothetical protein